MDKDFSYPILINPIVMFGIFAIFLIAFYVSLIRLWPLGKKGWKRVDYIWLSVAALGILGTAGALRRELASHFVVTAEIRAQSSYDLARDQISNLSGPAICQTFIKSEFVLPNFEERQQESNRVCEFGRGALNKIPPKMPKESSFPDFGKYPDVKDEFLKRIFTAIDQAIERYRISRSTLDGLRNDANRSPLDNNLLFLSPYLFAIALALRITKVTGELRLES